MCGYVQWACAGVVHRSMGKCGRYEGVECYIGSSGCGRFGYGHKTPRSEITLGGIGMPECAYSGTVGISVISRKNLGILLALKWPVTVSDIRYHACRLSETQTTIIDITTPCSVLTGSAC